MAQSTKRLTSKVIGFRIPNTHWIEWQVYCATINQDVTTFIKESVNKYLNAEGLKPKAVDDAIPLELSKLRIKESKIDFNKSTYLNLRIDLQELLIWDEYCAQNSMDRTELVLYATDRQLHPTRFVPMRDYERIKWILNNLIREIGLMDWSLIATIFDSVDPGILTKMLDSLEAKNFIMRKGQDAYVPTGESEPTINIRRVVENFENILATLRTNPEGADDLSPRLEHYELLEHESLLIVVFDYLDACINQFRAILQDRSSDPNLIRANSQIQQLRDEMLDLLDNTKKERTKTET